MHTFGAVEIKDRFLRGEVSAKRIVEDYFSHIAAVEPKVQAFLGLFKEKSLEKADRLDAKRRGGEKLGSLAGVTIAIKDNMGMKGERLTAGSKILQNYISPYDATVVRRIEEEDGIIIGRTNLDEFAMGSSCEHSPFQLTKNPWDLSLVPGGSSGGSAAAVCAQMASIALGSDTGGSIRLPGSFCGICGFKPTYGRVSRYGLVAFASSLDQIGPMAYRAEDIELMMSVIGRWCEKDSTSMKGRPFTSVSFQERFSKSFTVGVPWKFLEKLPKESLAVFQRSLTHLRNIGASIIDIDLSLLASSVSVYYILAPAEASTNLARFDGIRYGHRSSKAKTLDEVYDLSREEGFGDEVKRRILLGTFILSSGYQDAYYKQAQRVRQIIINKFDEAFLKCDVIAMPVSTGGAFPFGAKSDPLSMYLEDIYTIGANLAGLPAMSIPSGFLPDGRPIGLQILGNQQMDAEVIAIAKEFQRITQYHLERPTFKKGAGKNA